jgi:hypothetical protein
MACSICHWVGQYGLNVALLADKSLNCFLAGSPNETVSQRLARAREAGKNWSRPLCRALTWTWRLFGSQTDHCTWSLEPGSIAEEVWHWSPPEPIVNAPDLSAQLVQADDTHAFYNQAAQSATAYRAGFRRGRAERTAAERTP